MIEEFDEFPVFYFSNHNAIYGPSENIVCMPDHFDKLDYELEIAIVISKEGRNIKAKNASDYIAGFMIMNDISARGLQMEEMRLNLGPAKGKDFASVLGPFLVTPDEISDKIIESNDNGTTYDLNMTCSVNGRVFSKGNLSSMNWTFEQMIERISYGATIFPGDVIGSGTVGTGCLLEINGTEKFSKNGNEVVWGTIGNASTSQGIFFEAVNACGVLQIPTIISVWDDDYGISVHNKDHTTKESISKALAGFKITSDSPGIEILEVKGWDYQSLMKTYSYAEKIAREHHIPVIIHVTELTQPLGHSTSGSHERYKSEERLKWEDDNDCNKKFEDWILKNKISTKKKIQSIKEEVSSYVKDEKKLAWDHYQRPIMDSKKDLIQTINNLEKPVNSDEINEMFSNLDDSNFSELIKICRRLIYKLDSSNLNDRNSLINWKSKYIDILSNKYSTDLYSINLDSLSNIPKVFPLYSDEETFVDGRIIIRDNFDKLLENNSKIFIFGEDVGKIGDVNQGLEGLQKKHGKNRVFDTSIRESTIVGQGIGMSMRGLRPIAEIQYLDYILYALQILSDDLGTLTYRTHGGQKAPLIVRTRGHRLEGIWHSGSPLGGMISFLRGIFILTPRNMTKAAGFYNSLLDIDQPAVVIEPLNGYRTKEKLPSNYGEFKTPIGEIEILKEGDDITLVSYGSTFNIVMNVAEEIKKYGISCEVIDVQSLIPFDIKKEISKSVIKTNRLLIIDEDLPGGCSSFILQELLEKQDIYKHLDSEPSLLTAKDHRPPYGSDGDYASKPSFEDIFERIYSIMRESDPEKYRRLF